MKNFEVSISSLPILTYFTYLATSTSIMFVKILMQLSKEVEEDYKEFKNEIIQESLVKILPWPAMPEGTGH